MNCSFVGVQKGQPWNVTVEYLLQWKTYIHTYIHTYNFDAFMVPPVVGHSLKWFNNSTVQILNKNKRLTNELLKQLPFSTVQKKICGTPLSAAAGIDEIYPLNGHRLIRKREPMWREWSCDKKWASFTNACDTPSTVLGEQFPTYFA